MPDFMALLNNIPWLFPLTLQAITVYSCFLVFIIGGIILATTLRRELKGAEPMPGSAIRARFGARGTPAVWKGNSRRSSKRRFARSR